MLLSESNLLSLTHWWKVQSSMAIDCLPLKTQNTVREAQAAALVSWCSQSLSRQKLLYRACCHRRCPGNGEAGRDLGGQPLGSDFPCFTTTKIVFQEACLKEFSPSSPNRRDLKRAPFCHSQQHNAWVCLPAALSTAKATLPTQVFSQHSSKEGKHFPVHKAIPLPHSQEMPGSESSCSEISS